MKTLTMLFLSLCISTTLWAADESAKQFQLDKKEVCTQLIESGAPEEQIAQRGCCSWHDGVCGCGADGRVKCCDGTTSPSCTCHQADEGKGIVN